MPVAWIWNSTWTLWSFAENGQIRGKSFLGALCACWGVGVAVAVGTGGAPGAGRTVLVGGMTDGRLAGDATRSPLILKGGMTGGRLAGDAFRSALGGGIAGGRVTGEASSAVGVPGRLDGGIVGTFFILLITIGAGVQSVYNWGGGTCKRSPEKCNNLHHKLFNYVTELCYLGM